MGSIYRRKGSPFYWISYYQDGLQKRESSGSDKITKAKELLRKREGAIADGKPVNPKSEKIKFTQLAALVVDDYTINHYKSLESIKGRLKNHIIPAFGHRRVTTITTADLTSYVIERQAEGISNANVNRELSVIRRAFTLAIKAGLLFHKPHFPMLREDNARQGFLELEQFEMVVSKLRKPLQPVARFAYMTGWRIASEILPLEWRQVDFSAGTVRLFPGMTKNRKGRVFPFTRDLRAILEGQWIEAVRLKPKGGHLPLRIQSEGQVDSRLSVGVAQSLREGRSPRTDSSRSQANRGKESGAGRSPGTCRHAADRTSDPQRVRQVQYRVRRRSAHRRPDAG